MKYEIRPKNLRQQVAVERKRRNIVFFTAISLAFIYLGINLLFGDMGLIKYMQLKKNKVKLEAEIETIILENKSIKQQVTSLKQDPFYIEKHAREEYGLAKPDEYIFQFQKDGR
ncbi:MAG: septum formation initiator family protein [Dissulfurispiraceae bacterium]|jgi:cell division protein FtsB|nr:septum formation initiator family protein [Dissulfurispiraceae bacterium]